MGGTADVLPASRLRKRMAREVDVGERRAEQSRAVQSGRGSSTSRSEDKTRKVDHRQADQTRPDQTARRDSCTTHLSPQNPPSRAALESW